MSWSVLLSDWGQETRVRLQFALPTFLRPPVRRKFNLPLSNQTLLPLHKSLPRLLPHQRRRAEEAVEVEARQALHCYSSWHWGLVSSSQIYGTLTLFVILEMVLALSADEMLKKGAGSSSVLNIVSATIKEIGNSETTRTGSR